MVAVVVGEGVAAADVADEETAGLHGGGERLRVTAGRVRVGACRAAGAGPGAHGQEIETLCVQARKKTVKIRVVAARDLLRRLQIERVLALADGLKQNAAAVFRGARAPKLQLAAARRAAPLSPEAPAAVGAAHAAHLRQKAQRRGIEVRRGGEAAFERGGFHVDHPSRSSHSSKNIASTKRSSKSRAPESSR